MPKGALGIWTTKKSNPVFGGSPSTSTVITSKGPGETTVTSPCACWRQLPVIAAAERTMLNWILGWLMSVDSLPRLSSSAATVRTGPPRDIAPIRARKPPRHPKTLQIFFSLCSFDSHPFVVRTSPSFTVNPAGRGPGGALGETPNGLSANATLPASDRQCQ